ncbi:hypothetical protein ABT392_16820 [Paucibacter sp. JuS9]|uniref:hypothetical protein n=1 Tax=Paucibacter sp. JuS9 TaxID=3228748 RepID=UPI003756932A
MAAIVQGLSYILAKIVAALVWLGELAIGVFKAAWLFATDVVCWGFESVLALVTVILGAFDFSGLTAQAGAWAGLPAELLEVLAAIGLSTSVGLIVTALGIRLMLQLVPFTRLGS